MDYITGKLGLGLNRLCLAMVTGVLLCMIQSSPGNAQPAGVVAKTAAAIDADIWDIARGGQLYDNWMAALDATPPKGNHPAYPAVGKRKGKTTWRCKECHGWDYMGEDGAYGRGSHFTGIKGLRNVVGMEPEKIEKFIMDETHAYTSKMIPDSALKKLALFLSRGQVF